MESFLPIVMVAVVVVLIVVFGYHAHQRQKLRLAEMAGLAGELGWRFDAGRDSTHDDRYPQFKLFRRGHSRYAYNTLEGWLEIHGERCAVRMGDYHYRVTSGSGKSRRTRTYEFSYAILRLHYGRLPDLFIRQEGIFDAVASAFGFADIDFESAEFSKRFHVKSSDKQFAYDVVHSGMMEFLLGSDPPTIAVEEGACCLSDGRRKWEPGEFRARLEWAEQFFQLWPKHLVAALKSTTQAS